MRNRALVILACAFMGLAPFGARAEKADPAAAASSWSSPSLRSETVAGPNGAVTTSPMIHVFQQFPMPEPDVAIRRSVEFMQNRLARKDWAQQAIIDGTSMPPQLVKLD